MDDFLEYMPPLPSLTDRQVDEFRKIVELIWKKKLTRLEAKVIALRYLHLLDLLSRPLPDTAEPDREAGIP